MNSIKASRAEVLEELAAHHVGAAPTPYSPDAIRLASKPALTNWPAYREGRIEVQDEGSQLIARLLQPRRGKWWWIFALEPAARHWRWGR